MGPTCLFWDGRAGTGLVDPLTGQIVIPQAAALEAQALGPILNSTEMAHLGRTWADVTTRLSSATPLVLSPVLPVALEEWINGRGYPAVFEEAFCDGAVTPVRIAMAIVTYERALNRGQAPIDSDTQANPTLTAQERQGRGVLGLSRIY